MCEQLLGSVAHMRRNLGLVVVGVVVVGHAADPTQHGGRRRCIRATSARAQHIGTRTPAAEVLVPVAADYHR